MDYDYSDFPSVTALPPFRRDSSAAMTNLWLGMVAAIKVMSSGMSVLPLSSRTNAAIGRILPRRELSLPRRTQQFEASIRPGLDPARWGNRSNDAALTALPTGPTEMSIRTTPFRRFTLRLNGFASVHAGADAGEVITRPLRFTGRELVVNCSTSAGGSVRVTIQDAAGQPIPGYTLGETVPFVGDAIEQPLACRREQADPTRDVANLAGRPVRLRFELVDADLDTIQFC